MPDFLDALDKYEKQESGGGIICHFRLALGYKLFMAGMKNEATFFEFKPGDEASDAEAKARADKVAGEAEGVKTARKAVAFVLDKTTVKGREVGWQDDRWFVYPLWTDGYKKVIKPKIKELNLGIGEFWGRFGFVEDPSGRMGKDKDGNPRVEMIAFPAEVYPNEAAAEVAAGGEASASAFNVAEWAELKPDIAQAVKDKTKELKSPAKAKEAVAAEYQLTVPQLEQVLA